MENKINSVVVAANESYKIICSDNIYYMTQLKNKSFDVCFMDPPYNVGKNYNSHNDTMDESEYIDYLVNVYQEACRIAENVLVTPGNININLWIKHIAEPDEIIVLYTPNQFSVSKRSLVSNWEPLLCYGSARFKRSLLETKQYGLENYNITKKHPCPKNLSIMKQIFLNFEKDLPRSVIDPFLGSGTTLKACYDLGIYAVGIDKDIKYCELSRQRLAQRKLI